MSFNELGSTRPKFTQNAQREVYPAIDPTQPSLSMEGKIVLVTGGARGLGVAIVDSFAKARAQAIILVGRTEGPLKEAQARLTQAYPQTQFIVSTVDIGSRDSVQALFASLKSNVQKIDVIVNSAGLFSEYGPLLGETQPDLFWKDMDANIGGAYLLAHGQINFNAPEYPATFITLTSLVTEPYTKSAAYSLTKIAPIKMVSVLDLEYPNIRSYAIMPGVVVTDMAKDDFLPIALDKPSLIGGLSVYLCHPPADYLSGRFLDARWDINEVHEKKQAIIENDWLKLQIGGY